MVETRPPITAGPIPRAFIAFNINSSGVETSELCVSDFVFDFEPDCAFIGTNAPVRRRMTKKQRTWILIDTPVRLLMVDDKRCINVKSAETRSKKLKRVVVSHLD